MRYAARWVMAGMLVCAAPLAGQRWGGGPGGSGGMMRGNAPGLARMVEVALARADELGLDEARIIELRALRNEVDAARTTLREEREARRAETRAQVEAGECPCGGRGEAREQARETRERGAELLRPLAERYRAALTEEERLQVRRWATPGRSARPGLRPRSGRTRGGVTG
ncbi:MAG: hypothetical protein RQ751_05185 [Longimicrobiales bacterium]|nr:hypothetical protein [Longimicrobiales bacterium]